METRTFGRTGWPVSAMGYGMWGMGGWTGSNDEQSMDALHLAVEMGCNFFDTAYAYGEGHSESLLGELVRQHMDQRLYTASKIPPKSRQWPSRRGFTLADNYPSDYIRHMAYASLENLGLNSLDLIQFHTWEDAWAEDEDWQRAVSDLKSEGVIHAVGISVNRWEPWNGIAAMQTGLIDAVQVIYNIFDQNPEDALFPAAREHNVAIIARVPFDEGTLTGKLTKESRWPAGDWRNSYFVPENLNASVDRAEGLRPLIPADMDMPEMALRFILSNPTVSTIIPGMRKTDHVRANFAAADGQPLAPELLAALRAHRWDRTPTEWSQ